MVTGRVPFAFGIGFAAVWAGCGARTAGWGMSCCCPRRRQSTEPRLFFVHYRRFFVLDSIDTVHKKHRAVLGAVCAGSGGRTFAWCMPSCCPSRRQSTEPLLFLWSNGDFFWWTLTMPSTRKIARSAFTGIDTSRSGRLT